MKKTITALLSCIGIVAVGGMNAFANENLFDPRVNLFSSTSGGSSSLVRLYQPSPSQPPIDQAEDQVSTQVTVINNTNYTISYPRRRISRSERRRSALGHRYLGFTKQYSGYRYPF